jgi:MFS family permease
VLSGVTFALFYSTLAIPFARYADRANRRNLVSYCCAAWSFMTAMCGLAGSFWTLALARVGVAVGEAGGTAHSITMVADHYPPEQRGRAMSVYMLGPQLGILFGLGLGGWIAHHYGWRQAFLWMSIPGILAALLLRFTTVEPVRGRWEAALMALGFAGYGIGIWTPTFLMRSHGMTLQSAGAVMGILGGLAAVIGALFSGWLSDTLAKRNPRWRLGVPVVGCLLALPCGVMFYLSPVGDQWTVAGMDVPHAIVWYLLFGITTVWWMAPAYAAMSDIVAANRRATALAVFNLGLTMVGGGLGPLLVGMLSDGLTPLHGDEALRWALVYSMSAYAVGIVALLAAIGPYLRERGSLAPG